ncbi:MAG: hypothetical protein AB1918_17435 [Pseudomonadota bacterium]
MPLPFVFFLGLLPSVMLMLLAVLVDLSILAALRHLAGRGRKVICQ